MAHILLVDDNADLLKLQSEFLRCSGHHVKTASNGNEAISLTKDHRFDLVITDLIMPEKEGIETILELRRSYPGIKIIAISGGGRAGARDHLAIAKGVGALHTLAKPFSGPELLEVVTYALGKA
jgi:CheY-like chemotaxis protein